MASDGGSEVPRLITRLEEALRDTPGTFKRNGILVVGLFVVISISFAAQGAWGAAAFGGVFGLAIAALMYAAIRRNRPENMRPVIDAVRDAPDKITLLRHYQSSDSRRVFVTDWLQVSTKTHHLIVKAKDWEHLLDVLKHRCPQANVLDK